MDIELEPGTRVISQRPYRIPEKINEGVRKEIEDMLEGGIIEESENAWSSPIVPVLKPNGAVRVCVDYRKLNAKPNVTYLLLMTSWMMLVRQKFYQSWI